MRFTAVLGAAMLLCLCAMRPALAAPDQDRKALEAQENAFLRMAAQNDLFMQKLGDYAAKNAATTQVQDLGRKIAEDHRSDMKALRDLGRDHNLPNLGSEKTDLTATQKSVYDRLTSKKGLPFDKEYTKLLVKEHTEQVAQYQREADKGQDNSVREYAAKTLPTLKEHLQAAKDAESAVWK